MSLIHKFKLMAKGKNAKIGIGLGTSELHNQKILKACIDFLGEHPTRIYIFGNRRSIQHIDKQFVHLKESP